MFLTQIIFNPYKRGARQLLSNPERLHSAVIESFTPETLKKSPHRPLYRIETYNHNPRLIISSETIPSVEHIVEQGGRENDPNTVSIKNYDTFLNNLKTGESFLFKIKLNPTIKHRNNVIPLKLTDQYEWLINKMLNHGYEVNPQILQIKENGILDFWKQKQHVTVNYTLFQGIVTITNSEKATEVIRTGIGRNKAYGMGLLSLGYYK